MKRRSRPTYGIIISIHSWLQGTPIYSPCWQALFCNDCAQLNGILTLCVLCFPMCSFAYENVKVISYKHGAVSGAHGGPTAF